MGESGGLSVRGVGRKKITFQRAAGSSDLTNGDNRNFSIVSLGGFCIAARSSDPETLWASCHCRNYIKLELCLGNTSNLGSGSERDRDLSANVVSGISDVSCEHPMKFIN